MKYIDADLLRAVIKEHTLFYAGQANLLDGTNALDGYDEVLAIIDSLQQEQLPGIEENGIPGKDFIPVEWVDACEKYGKWKIVKVEKPDFPTTDEQIKEFLATHPKIEVPEKYKNPDWLFKKQEQPEVFDSAAFQKGVAEGRRLEKEDAEHLRDATKKIREDLALTIADIEKLHTFLYAVKNNKQGAFTFTRLTDEQYEEVLRRFNKTKEQ